MSDAKHIARLLSTPGGLAELLRHAATDEVLAKTLDDLDEMTAEQALTMLGAMSEADDPADDIDEKAAAEVREDVRRLCADAPRSELDLVGRLDPFHIDGAVEALSNMLRRAATGRRQFTWLLSQDLYADGERILGGPDLQLEVARYLELWEEDQSDAPAAEAVALVTWARRAAVRAPELFRHASVIDVTAEHVLLVPRPRSDWSKPRRDRWSKRSGSSSAVWAPSVSTSC